MPSWAAAWILPKSTCEEQNTSQVDATEIDCRWFRSALTSIESILTCLWHTMWVHTQTWKGSDNLHRQITWINFFHSTCRMATGHEPIRNCRMPIDPGSKSKIYGPQKQQNLQICSRNGWRLWIPSNDGEAHFDHYVLEASHEISISVCWNNLLEVL
jgi:hypothetical protein